jgi:predicted HicB family RNase H-like nuclease
MKDGNFEFPIPTELREKLKAYALAHDMSMAQVVRQALRELFGKATV